MHYFCCSRYHKFGRKVNTLLMSYCRLVKKYVFVKQKFWNYGSIYQGGQIMHTFAYFAIAYF
jgi:hypothetical protein